VGPPEPRDAHASPEREPLGALPVLDDGAHDLMAEDERQLRLRELAVDDVHVRPADAASVHAQTDLAGCELGRGTVDELERRPDAGEEDGAHASGASQRPAAPAAPAPQGSGRYVATNASVRSAGGATTGSAARTTLRACVSAALAKTSYASSASARSKRCVANGVGSSRPPSIKRSSSGVVTASTRPVVIVTSRIQSDSRCNVAGDPCTPTLATWPPGRTSAAQSSNVDGTPTASTATSTPWPFVSSVTFSIASSLPLLIVTSAPNSSARASRASARSIATIIAG